MQGIDTFLINQFRGASSSEYEDLLILKEYIDGKNEDKEAAFICDIVEQMSELRFEAEDAFLNSKTVAKNGRGELCIEVRNMADKLTRPLKTDPPEQLISIIAKRDYGMIDRLIKMMRKILRRKRSMVQVAEVQQVDTHCMRWLSRQPGRTAVEKAGERQRILAIVREETNDTLENRVLKDFVRRAMVLARRYLKLYDVGIYRNSDRIKDVKKLQSLLSVACRMPEMRILTAIKGTVQPNYVLLHDALYSKMWVQYRLILAHARIAEIVWPYRHILFGEYLSCWLSMRLCLMANGAEFDCTHWIRLMPEKGRFFVNSLFSNVYRIESGILDWRVSRHYGEISVALSSGERKKVRVAYIPSCCREQPISVPANGEIYVVCCFSDEIEEMLAGQNNVMLPSSGIDEMVTNLLKKLGV